MFGNYGYPANDFYLDLRIHILHEHKIAIVRTRAQKLTNSRGFVEAPLVSPNFE